MALQNYQKFVVEIKKETLFKFLALVIFLIFLVYLKNVVFLLITSFIAAATFRPLYLFMTKRKVPHIVAAIMVVISFFAIFIGLLSVITLFLVHQVGPFVEQLSISLKSEMEFLKERLFFIKEYVGEDAINNFILKFSGELGVQIGNLSSTLWNALLSTLDAAGFIISIVTTFVLSVYLLVGWDKFLDKIGVFCGTAKGEKIKKIMLKVENKIGSWFRGQLFLCFIVGLVTTGILLLLRVRYALVLGFLAGVLEIIPVVGPILAAIPIVIAGFSTSIGVGILSIVSVIIIQQLENSILVPIVMRKAVGLNPVITLIGVIIGKEIMGLVGVLLAIPVLAVITVFFQEYFVSSGIIKEEKTEPNSIK